MREFAVFEAPVLSLSEEGPVWVEAINAKTYKTAQYGDVPVTPDKLMNMIKNFKENVRGQEIAVDFEHGTDVAKGNAASGWYKDFEIRPSSSDPNMPALFAQVEFTDEAKKEIKDKKWRYFSLDWMPEWADNDGNKFNDVIVGGALTNRPIAKKMLPINFSELALEDKEKQELLDESKEWEHSEPGTGTPPEPRKDEDGSDDPAIAGGWRRQTPPPSPIPDPEDSFGWSETPKRVTQQPRKEASKLSVYSFDEKNGQELLRVLDLPVDADPSKVVDSVKIAMGELDDFKKAENKEEQEKKFAEQFPMVWAEHVELMETNRKNAAHAFSETVTKVRKMEGKGALKTTGMELSKVALDKIEEVHRKFADTGDEELVAAYEEVVKSITQGGIIQFGEIGTTADGDEDPGNYDPNTAAGIAGARKAFAELMRKAKAEDSELTDDQALAQVAQKHPDLFEASRKTVTA